MPRKHFPKKITGSSTREILRNARELKLQFPEEELAINQLVQASLDLLAVENEREAKFLKRDIESYDVLDITAIPSTATNVVVNKLVTDDNLLLNLTPVYYMFTLEDIRYIKEAAKLVSTILEQAQPTPSITVLVDTLFRMPIVYVNN